MELRDHFDATHAVIESTRRHHEGHIFSTVEDTLTLASSGARMQREYIVHDDAVGVVAVKKIAGVDHVLLIRQYRHPVRSVLWEVPAGLLDIEGEEPVLAAARELAEEADLEAESLEFLVRFYTSPGCSTELLTVFLATGLREVSTDFVREDEEAEIEKRWFPVAEVLEAIDRGDLANPTLVIGVHAAARRLGLR